ncbi:MAG TPA: sugar transporter [Candidatus Coprenecus stercoravium]|uniref:Sugar transporter n=1 Tax=Candidatus Coprenecus stercoravium TaxID=2840735 RepID=A0A9D2KAT0_9BACT|nr:sugar transporter [Candidatus Coprenecus stercoravium]
MLNISISKGHVLKEWLPLVALACSTFIFNTSEFIPIGLLSDIAADFAITESKAGLLITIYAWVVAIASLPLMLTVSGIESKRLMLGIFGLFVISHVGSAFSSGYYMLMMSRIGVACSHAIFWSIVTPLAVKIAPKGKGSAALSIIIAGSSIAMIAGLPLGRAIGLVAGWRMTFLIIGCVSFAVMLLIAAVLPRTQGQKAFSLKQLPGLLRTPSLSGIYLVTVLSVTAHFTGYSYIEPFLAQIAGFNAGSITMVLTLFGIMGLIGSLLFSRYFDSHRSFFTRYAVIGIGCCLMLLHPAAAHHQTVLALCVFWGLANCFYNMVFQSEIIRTVPEGTSIAMSIYSGIYNVGIGSGALIGGCVCSGIGVGAIGYIGGLISISACLCCIFYLQPRLK